MPKRNKAQQTGFQYVLGWCWVGPQRWHIEFCDDSVEASFRRRIPGGGLLEMGKTIWAGQDNVIRINAELLLSENAEEIINTIVHEIGHVALEGYWSKLKGGFSESEVENILESLDAPLGQALLTLGLVSTDFIKPVKEAYLQFLEKKNRSRS